MGRKKKELTQQKFIKETKICKVGEEYYAKTSIGKWKKGVVVYVHPSNRFVLLNIYRDEETKDVCFRESFNLDDLKDKILTEKETEQEGLQDFVNVTKQMVAYQQVLDNFFNKKRSLIF